jgi:F420-non-reducing hydrogenase iron-sulfur subunit
MTQQIQTKEDQIEFEPKIVMFCCNWCTYQGANLAGLLHYQLPTNVRLIRVMCSGRIDPMFVLKTLTKFDAVLVTGCHLGDCHYIDGNAKALRRMKILERMLSQFDLEPERFQLHWISSAEANKFREVVVDVVKNIKRLGPNPLISKNPGILPV